MTGGVRSLVALAVALLACNEARAGPAQPVLPEPLSFRAIADFVRSRDIRSTEALLEALPEELRANFVLVFKSRNRSQPVSPDRPRVILFSRDGRFAMTFPGDASGSIEILEYDDALGILKPRLIELDPGAPAVLIEDPLRQFDGKHPKNCASCHGKETHFVWDAYPKWAGMYGQVHHTGSTAAAEELELYEGFMRKNGKTGIYRHLPGLSEATLEELAERNVRITDRLSEVNARRVLSRLRASTGFERYRGALLSLSAATDRQFEKLLPPEALSRFRSRSAALNESIRRKIEVHADRVDRRILGASRQEVLFDDYYVSALARAQFVADELGVSTEHWWMTLEPGSFRAASGSDSFIHDISRTLAEEILSQGDPREHVELARGVLRQIKPFSLKRTAESPACLKPGLGGLSERINPPSR